MRGLPYSATEADITDFFSALVTPTQVFLEYDNFGRPSGGAEVLFASHDDAMTGMKKDRAHMGMCVSCLGGWEKNIHPPLLNTHACTHT